jgi:hypothetical protein
MNLLLSQMNKPLHYFFLAMLVFFATNVFAQQSAGVVQFVAGNVEITRGAQKLTVARATIVNVGDIIKTDATGSVQINMVDGAYISLRPGTEMRVEKYDFNPAQPTLGDAALELIVGVMRTFTGELTSRNRDRFVMKTKIANLGIRGSSNVFANYPESGTINHTLSGAHIMTSTDAQGMKRSLISLPGQTVQVLPGQAPRFIPTPAFITQASSPAPKATSSGQKEEQAAPATDSSGASAAAPATPPSSTTTAATPPPSQAGTAAVGTQIQSNQTINNALIVGRGPGSLDAPLTGYEGIFLQSGGNGTVIVNSANQIVEVRNAQASSFLAGPAALPNGYTAGNALITSLTWTGGTYRDAYRNADGSIILGRWQGGTLNIVQDPASLLPGDTPTTSFALGNNSIAWGLFRPTPVSVFSAFTGSATYSLVGATAPTDALGNVGTFNSATVGVNFGQRTATLNASLSINNQNLTLGGTTSFAGGFGWNRSGTNGNLTIGCAGSNCAAQGYDGSVGVVIAGATGASMGGQYRITPIRAAGQGYTNHIAGTFALQAASNPTVAPPIESVKIGRDFIMRSNLGADFTAMRPMMPMAIGPGALPQATLGARRNVALVQTAER